MIADADTTTPAQRSSNVLIVIPNLLTEAAPILVEIAERFHELEEIKLGLSADIVQRLSDLADESLTAYRFTVRLLHGDAKIFSSFEEQARERALSKQAVHAEFRIILSKIERIFPELAWQIREQRRAIQEIEIVRCRPFDETLPGKRSGQVLSMNRGNEE